MQPQLKSLRSELEAYVYAWNTHLKDAIPAMDEITLLRNAHPSYRPDFASKLRDAKVITTDQAREFIKIVGQK